MSDIAEIEAEARAYVVEFRDRDSLPRWFDLLAAMLAVIDGLRAENEHLRLCVSEWTANYDRVAHEIVVLKDAKPQPETPT